MHHRTQGTGANPLRRDADRTRTRMRAAFALICLLAVVVGFALGRAAWTDGHRTAENIARHRHTVTATTVGETGYRAGDQPSSRPVTVASATWHYPAQRSHTETIPVPAGTRNGDTVRVWVDENGSVAAAPPGQADIALNAVGIGTGALAGIVLAGGALVAVRLRVLDARSARAWESEWAGVEPLWSGRLRPGQGAGDD
ncbi:Rv1733c family protein [Streptomyces flavotricini]|uniref:Rv1733c family protein n=1 Tax=Streptomyces flavotricini TaxID=66888 RepID=UPI003FD6C812